jgi:alpha-ketoglutarate-dependent taurine dioxygenase
MSDADAVQTITLPGEFGAAEVVGVVPEIASIDTVRETVRSALAVHAVLCLRQPNALDDDGFRSVARIFGPIKDPVGRTKTGGTLRYGEERQIIDAGFVLTDELRADLGDLSFGGLDERRPGLFETFHTDDSYVERPAWVTVLHSRELPRTGGGATRFLDMRAAYRRLEPAVRRRILGLMALNRYNNDGAFPPRVSAQGPFEALVDVAHPIVRAHPATGAPALYLDLDRATSVEGMEEGEGRELLRFLQEHAEQTAPSYTHTWRDHDVLVWDNTAVQHRASGDFQLGEARSFWRYMIEGPVPQPYREEDDLGTLQRG